MPDKLVSVIRLRNLQKYRIKKTLKGKITQTVKKYKFNSDKTLSKIKGDHFEQQI